MELLQNQVLYQCQYLISNHFHSNKVTDIYYIIYIIQSNNVILLITLTSRVVNLLKLKWFILTSRYTLSVY